MSTVYLTPWNGCEGEQQREKKRKEKKTERWLNQEKERMTARWPELTESCSEAEFRRKQSSLA